MLVVTHDVSQPGPGQRRALARVVAGYVHDTSGGRRTALTNEEESRQCPTMSDWPGQCSCSVRGPALNLVGTPICRTGTGFQIRWGGASSASQYGRRGRDKRPARCAHIGRPGAGYAVRRIGGRELLTRRFGGYNLLVGAFRFEMAGAQCS